MKKAKVVFPILFALFFIIAGITTACNQSTGEWQVENLINDKIFSQCYSTEGCSILVYRDGTGVVTYAYDYEQEISQHVSIKNGRKIRESHEKIWESENGLAYAMSVRGYDIFYVKYRQSAMRHLPKKILKLFGGYWGIK